MIPIDTIFASTAPLYWAKGLPAIPLQPRTKIPLHSAWNQYATRMVDPADQQEWLHRHPNANIGLPMGEQSGLIAVDVDTDDIRVARIIKETLPPTPWVRVGKKGAVYIYRWNGHKTFRIRTAKGESLLEVLSSGTQIVLPPSIHPDTQMPYQANAFLPDVLDQVPALSKDLESVLRSALIEAGYELSTKGFTKVTEVISTGSRDNKMTSVAGIMAKGVTRGERTLAEAMGEMRAWVENFTEKVAGDSMDPQKAVQKLVEFILKDVEIGGRQLAVGWDRGLEPKEMKHFHALFGEDSESWDLDRMLNYLETKFTGNDRLEGVADRNTAIEHIIQKLARNPQITPMEEDIVLEFISTSSGRLVSKGALRKRLLQLRRGTVAGETHAEIAQMVIEELRKFGHIRFDKSNFWQWRGAHWETMQKSAIMSTIAIEYGHLPAARRNSDHEGIFKMMQALCACDLDQSPTRGLNFANGFLTTDLSLLPHNEDFGCTYVLPYIYDVSKAGHCQKFLSFLHQSWGHSPDYEDKVAALREAIAVTLFGLAPMYQKAFCCMGVPHSGKTVLMNIIQSILPTEATCHVAPSNWDDKFLPTMMVGKLANFCGELSESEMIPGDVFKSVIDGETMSGQLKGQQIFTFKPSCAHWFASNHLPRTRDSSGGFSRRWVFLEFDKSVKVQDRVNGLANDIAAEEQEAIVAWAVAVMPELQRRGYITSPQSQKRLTDEMSGMNNSVRYFMTGGVVEPNEDMGTALGEQEIHASYFLFCRERGARPVSMRIFRQRMAELQSEFGFELGYEVGPSGGEVVRYRGLEFVPLDQVARMM